ncbi:hypothetical protein TRIUR3_11700 [Triticum urartu]|uniref:Uncharacterized protein n=2 Tax=Triticum urartu TaxID=4572 RepID=M7YHW2_TRIUA|nr:uncharacterized protein LOC125524885 [Triticum urartu]EMS46376.1 hypothetical protein TRIUR3_11700 [Triticum urartu]
MVDIFVAGAIYYNGSYICAGISLWRVIQRDYGSMDGDITKANLMPALDLFYSLILCQGALFVLWGASLIADRSFITSLHRVCKFPKMWGFASVRNYLHHIRSKCWRGAETSMEDRGLVKYAVDLLDSESSQEDYLSGARMLDVFIKVHQVDVRPLILPSSQKVQKLIDTLRWSSSESDREIKELAARIFAHLAFNIDLTQFPGAIRCISSLLGTTQQLYWNNDQQGSSNQSPQSNKLDQQGAGDSQGDLGTTPHQSPQSRFYHLYAKIQKVIILQLNAKIQKCILQGAVKRKNTKNTKGTLDQQGAGDSKGEGDGCNELILQGLTILERLASDQHNCRDICSTPDLIAKIMSPICSDTLIQDINIMPWQDVVNGALRVVYRLIHAPEWTGGRRLAHEISISKQAVSNLEMILDQGNIACQQLQMRAMEIITELTLDSAANLAMETKENLINKQLQIFLNEGTEEDLKVTAGKTLASLSKTTGTFSVCIMSKYNHIVDQLTEILDAKNKAIYRTIAAEILENLCTLHMMDKNHVKNTLLPKVLAEVLASKKKPPSEAPECHVSKASGDIEENPLQDDEENQRPEHNVQINSSELNETQTSMMVLKEALLSLTLVIFDKWIISAEDFDDVAQKVAPGEGEFVAKLKTIVEENCEATANNLRIVKLCGQIAVTMMRRSQYSEHFKDQKFVETLSKASKITCNLESCMLFAGTDGGAKKTARPLLSDLVKEAEALVA